MSNRVKKKDRKYKGIFKVDIVDRFWSELKKNKNVYKGIKYVLQKDGTYKVFKVKNKSNYTYMKKEDIDKIIYNALKKGGKGYGKHKSNYF